MTRIRFEDLPSTNTPRNAENLNKLNNVVISPTEPTTGEEVWIDIANKKIHTKNDNDVYEEFSEAFKMEEGGWTPSIGADYETAPTVTYSKRRGYYKKIGKMVYVEFYIEGKITALNGTNNYAMVNGLPYAVHSDIYFGQACLHLGTLYNLINSPDAVTLVIYNGNKLRIQNFFGATAGRLIASGDKSFMIGGSGWYMID